MQKRIVTVQDISCVGQCSITVALPIISAYGIETAILPSAVLSTHTGGFKGYTFKDLTDELPAIINHWEKENLNFDALYTGYIGNYKQFEHISAIREKLLREGAKVVIDPVMGDAGKLYPGFDIAFAQKMAEFLIGADYIIPNITEACFLTGAEYRENYDESYIKDLISRLKKLNVKNIIITGVSYQADKLGICLYDCENDSLKYHFEDKINAVMHGTGDVYASSFVGAMMSGSTALEAAAFACHFVREAMLNTFDDKSHFYGVNFEGVLHTIGKR